MAFTNTPEMIARVQSLLAGSEWNEALETLNAHSLTHGHSPESSHLKSVCLSKCERPLEAIYWARHALTQNRQFQPALQLLLNLISQPEHRWVRAFIENPIDLVLDVGANTGQFAKELRTIGYAGVIHSFEPVPNAYRELVKNASNDPLWQVHPVGLGRTPGTLSINISGNNAESSSFLEMGSRHLEVAPESRTVERFDAKILTVDQCMRELGFPGTCRMLKVDTQGYESEVLAGAADTLGGFRFLHLELSLVPLYNGQKLMHELLAVCYEAGFAVVDLHPYMFDGRNGHLLQVNALLERDEKNVPLDSPPKSRPRLPEKNEISQEELSPVFQAASDALSSGNLAEAAEIAREISVRTPWFFPIYNFHGTVLERLGDFQRALECYQKAIQLNPGHALAFTRRALILTRHSIGNAVQVRVLDEPLPCVTMTSLGSLGRFGNQLIQYAILRLYARKAGAVAVCPDWIGRDLYALDDPTIPSSQISTSLHENAVIEALEGENTPANVELQGFFSDTFERWKHRRDEIRAFFKPSPKLLPLVESWVTAVRSHGSEVVAIHLRRGDFDGETFWKAPEEIYLNWLNALWPTLANPVLYVASDEPSVIAAFEKFAPISAVHLEGKVPGIEFYTDHAIITHADHVAVSPSTFSWTACWLNTTAKSFSRPNRATGSMEPWDPWGSNPAH